MLVTVDGIYMLADILRQSLNALSPIVVSSEVSLMVNEHELPSLNADWKALVSIVVTESGKVKTRYFVSWNALAPMVVSCVSSSLFTLLSEVQPQNILLGILVKSAGRRMLAKAVQFWK